MKLSFSDFKLGKTLLDSIAEAGFIEPTEIQAAVIKPILAGRQVVGIAQTGTGKTAAFGIPIIAKLNYAQGDEPRALILSPTRELAMQTAEHLKVLAALSSLRVLVLYGGTGTKEQKEALKSGQDIIVATPGRLVELYSAEVLSLRQISIFVIDEADKMMDMGFIRSINRILEILPVKKQNLLFSATMDKRVEALYADFMDFPLICEISRQATPAVTVTQHMFVLPGYASKLNLLVHLLKHKTGLEAVIVFCKTKAVANRIFAALQQTHSKNSVRVIHGNKDQNSRIQAMRSLREGVITCLVATDVASRGIDIPEIRYVINFDVPLIPGDYVHRIGRTGRAGLSGEAYTFCGPHEIYYLRNIEKLIRQKIPISLIPQGVSTPEPEPKEKKEQDREIDLQRKNEDPDFKGAFHEKKSYKPRKKPVYGQKK